MSQLLVALVTVEPTPTVTRGLLELMVVLLGAGKWPALAIAAGAGLVAWNNKPAPGQSELPFGLAFLVACGAAGWFMASLVVG